MTFNELKMMSTELEALERSALGSRVSPRDFWLKWEELKDQISVISLNFTGVHSSVVYSIAADHIYNIFDKVNRPC